MSNTTQNRVNHFPVESLQEHTDSAATKLAHLPVEVVHSNPLTADIEVQAVHVPVEVGMERAPAANTDTRLVHLAVEVLGRFATAIKNYVFTAQALDANNCPGQRVYDINVTSLGPYVQLVHLPVEAIYTNPNPSNNLSGEY